MGNIHHTYEIKCSRGVVQYTLHIEEPSNADINNNGFRTNKQLRQSAMPQEIITHTVVIGCVQLCVPFENIFRICISSQLPVMGCEFRTLFVTYQPQLWRSGLERSLRKRKVGCSNPSHDRPTTRCSWTLFSHYLN